MSEAENESGKINFAAPIRLHHLSGGAMLIVGDNAVGMVMSPAGQYVFQAGKTRPVQSFFQSYRRLRVLGRTTFQNADEMQDPVTDHFAITACAAENRCLANMQQHYWKGVSVVCYREGKSIESVTTSRIASQIRTCTRRLERLSMAYRTVLAIAGRNPQESKIENPRNDKYAQHIGTEFRSMLNELYGLRDAVNAAVYRFKYRCQDGFQTASLKKLVKGDPTVTARLIGASMFDAESDLLLDRMSLYRGVALHSLGMNNARLSAPHRRARSTR